MKKFLALPPLALCLAASAFAEALSALFTVQTADGSRFLAQPLGAGVHLAAAYAVVDIGFEQVRSLTTTPDGQARAELKKGDRLFGELRDEFLELKTLAGNVKLPVSALAALAMPGIGWFDPEYEKSMVLYFPFDNEHDRTHVSEGSEKAVASAQGARWDSNGICGGALYFSGRSSWMRVPNSLAVNSPVFSFCFWARAEAMEPNSFTAPYGLVGKHKCHANYQSFDMVCFGDGMISVHISGKNVPWDVKIAAPSEPLEGKWCFLALVHDGERAYLYVNAKPAGQCEVSEYKGNSYDLLIGAMEYGLNDERPQHGWHGWLDEFRMFNTALNAQRIAELYRYDLWRAGRGDASNMFAASKNSLPLKVRLELADGSSLHAELRSERIELDGTAVGAIAVPLVFLEAVNVLDANGTVAVVLRNGDVWRGVLRQAEFEVATQLGDLRVKRELLRVMAAKDAEPVCGLLPRLGEPAPVAADAGEISRLVSVLLADGAAEKSEAAKQLLQIGDAAVPALEKALAFAAPDRRWWLEAVLEQIKKQEKTR